MSGRRSSENIVEEAATTHRWMHLPSSFRTSSARPPDGGRRKISITDARASRELLFGRTVHEDLPALLCCRIRLLKIPSVRYYIAPPTTRRGQVRILSRARLLRISLERRRVNNQHECMYIYICSTSRGLRAATARTVQYTSCRYTSQASTYFGRLLFVLSRLFCPLCVSAYQCVDKFRSNNIVFRLVSLSIFHLLLHCCCCCWRLRREEDNIIHV